MLQSLLINSYNIKAFKHFIKEPSEVNSMFGHDELLSTVPYYTVRRHHTMITICINSCILGMM